MTTFYVIYFAGVVVALLLYILSLRLSIKAGLEEVPSLASELGSKEQQKKAINGTGYGWQNSEGKKPLACCLGISPFLLYGEPTLSSLADDGLSHSSAGIPLEPKKAFDLTDQFIKIIKKQTEDDQ